MDAKTKTRMRGRMCGLLLSGVLALGAVLAASAVQEAQAAEIGAGWWQVGRTPTLAKLAGRADAALAAQNPKAQVKVSTSKRAKTITVSVSCKVQKAGIQKAKSKQARAYASMLLRVYAGNLYRDARCTSVVATCATVHGVNDYGTDRAADTSLAVGRAGTAKVYARYDGLLCSYRGGVFSKSSYQRELYCNRTKRVKVASVSIPKGYKLKLKLATRKS